MIRNLQFLEVSHLELWRKDGWKFLADCVQRFADSVPPPLGDDGNLVALWRSDYRYLLALIDILQRERDTLKAQVEAWNRCDPRLSTPANPKRER